MCFGQKVKTQQQHKTAKMKYLPEQGIEPGTAPATVGCVTSGPLSQLNVSF